ncbi:MAG: hypothetical protein ACO3C1_09895 [Ilumatobacteraceae bacterium]
MARRGESPRDSLEIEIEPVRRTASQAPRAGTVDDADELSGSTGDTFEAEAEAGVPWQVAAVVVVATLALVGVSVIGLTRPAVDLIAVATSTTTVGARPTTEPVPTATTIPADEIGAIAEEGAPWPSDVALIVAGEHGIDRVTGEKGEAVITRLDIPDAVSGLVDDPTTGTTVETTANDDATSVERAFEVQDGSLVFQYTRGDIVRLLPDGSMTVLVPAAPGVLLEDADMPGADPNRLTYVYRTAGDTEGAAFSLAIQSGTRRVETPVMGGWGVSYGRFTLFLPTVAATTWVDDTFNRGTAYVQFPTGQQARASVDPSGTAVLQFAGDPNEGGSVLLTTDYLVGGVDNTPRAVQQTSTVRQVDARGSSVVVYRDDDTSEYLDLEPFRRFDIPVRGFATVSRFVHSPLIENVSSALTQDNPRTCIIGLPGNNHSLAPYADDLDADQIAGADPSVVDGFAALIATLDDGSFVVRVTFDACVLHLRGSGITRSELEQFLLQADVGHVGVWDVACPPNAYCVPTSPGGPETTSPSIPSSTPGA